MASLKNSTFKEEITPILQKLFQKLEDQGIFPNSCCEANIILTLKLEKYVIKKKKNKRHTNIINDIDFKKSQHNFNKWNPTMDKRVYYIITK